MNFSHILKANIAGKLVNHLLVFLINVVMVRLLGVEQSGRYFNELYLINFTAFFFSFGLDFAAIAWLGREPGLFSLLHRSFFSLVIVVSVFIFFINSWLFSTSFITPMQDVLTITLFAGGQLALILFQGLLSADKKFNTQNFLLIGSNLIFLLILFLLRDRTYTLDELTRMYAGLIAFQGVLMMMASHKPSPPEHAQINYRNLFRYGIQVMVSSLIYFVFLRADNFFVEKYADAGTLSNYVQCGKVGQYFIYFSSVISSTLIPFIASEELAKSYSDWLKLIRPYVFIIVTGAVLVCLTGPWLFPLVFGSAFDSMHSYMNILMPGYVCLGILTLMNAVYLGKGDVRTIFRGDLMALILLLLLDLFLVPRFGVMMAATVSSVCSFLLCLYLWIQLRKHFN
jgi:O-antigen/teichoic acid export membrane protein